VPGHRRHRLTSSRAAHDARSSRAGDARDDDGFRDVDKLLAPAKRPNVAVKASALPCYSTAPYPYRDLHPHLKRVYDTFGPQRMFRGSDLSRLKGSYRECVTMFTEEMQWLSATDLEWIMGRALCEWLGRETDTP
jgi:predicted TIM-barrel fold metal-dependent hydrolase